MNFDEDPMVSSSRFSLNQLRNSPSERLDKLPQIIRQPFNDSAELSFRSNHQTPKMFDPEVMSPMNSDYALSSSRFNKKPFFAEYDL